jgi:transposase InsO family protein
VANRTSLDVEEAIVTERKRLVDLGVDAGPATISFHLADLPGLPSEATIWRILSARGFIVADPTKRPKRSGRSFTAERANDCWQLDDTGWELADGTEVKILNVIDDHSRLAVASEAMPTCTGDAALEVLAAAAAIIGWPARFLSDNATAFRHTLARAVGELGVGAGHSRPYHPQTCGKVERFHQTLKKWLAARPAPATIVELQTQLNLFRLYYNNHRPHRAIGRRPPAEVWTQAPKNGPASRPLDTPTTLGHSVVHGGRINLTSRHRISVGAVHNGNTALTVTTGRNCHVFIEGRHIRRLTINPNRRTQPLHPTPGRPPATVSKDPRHA